MEQTTQQPGQPGTTVRRAATPAPPVIRTRQEAPAVHTRRPSGLTRGLEAAQTYILNEETLVLVEFLVVVVIGIVVFRAVLYPMENFMAGLGHAISNLGIGKLFK
jgi:hypothetical protein